MNIRIQETLCRRCGRCQRVCPTSIFGRPDGQVPKVSHPEGCIACGHCVDVCPAEAIVHEAIPLSSTHKVERQLLPTPQSLLELMRSRRSNRTITGQPISPEAMADILEAARYAPTAENTRRVHLTVIDQADQLQAVEDTTMKFFLRLSHVLLSAPVRPFTRRLLPDLYAESPELVRFEQRWKSGERPCSCNATVLLAFSTPKGYDFGPQDANLAYQNASLMAESHGLTQIYMGLILTATRFLSAKRVCKLLHLPEGHRLQALMALGHPQFHYARYTER